MARVRIQADQRKVNTRRAPRRTSASRAIATVAALAIAFSGLQVPAFAVDTPTSPPATDPTPPADSRDGIDPSVEPDGSATAEPAPEPVDPETDHQDSDTGSSGIEEITPEDAEEKEILPRTVPIPVGNQVVISVRIGGDRLPGGGMSDVQATGVAGVKLHLGPTGGYETPFSAWNYSWATCTSDADGDCNFTVPIATTTGASGMAVGARPFIGQKSGDTVGTPGWHMATVPFSTQYNNYYSYQLNTTVSAGSTYRSTADHPMLKLKSDSAMNSFTDLGSRAPWATSSGRWMVVRDNPALPSTCGMNVAVVMDLSSSIGSALPTAKSALNSLIDALTGTPSSVALFNFNTLSPAMQPVGRLTNYPNLQSVRTSAEAAAVKSIYSSWQLGTSVNGYTNWDQGLSAVADASPKYDVVVLLTDGISTIHSNSEWVKPLSSQGWGPVHTTRSHEAAVFSANKVKAEGTRVVPFYVSPDAPTTAELNHTVNISGTAPGSDYYIASNYTAAAQQLASFAKANCQSSVRVEKRVVAPSFDVAGASKAQLDANSTPAPGWAFSATGSSSVTVTGSTFTTAANGRITVPVKFTNPATAGTVSLRETQQAGYSLVPVNGNNAYCVNANTGAAIGVSNLAGPATPGFTVATSTSVPVECVIYNQGPPPGSSSDSTVVMTKRVVDSTFTAANPTKAQLDANSRPAENWQLNATARNGASIDGIPGNQLTDANGTVVWPVKFSGATTKADFYGTETQQLDYTLIQVAGKNAVCSTPDGAAVEVSNYTDVGFQFKDQLAKGVTIQCTLYNKAPTSLNATINVSKRVQNPDGGNERPAAGWTLGAEISPDLSKSIVHGTPTSTTQVTPASGTTKWDVQFGTPNSLASVKVWETQQADWVFVEGTCTITPKAGGAVRTETISQFSGTVLTGIAPGDNVDCTFVNRMLSGSVTWEKVHGSDHLSGSVWKLTGPGSPGTEISIEDCSQDPCTGKDLDERPGYFSVSDLAFGSYSLVETKAPAGYVLDQTPHNFTVSAGQPAADLGKIQNRQQLVPGIPLTGGIGRDQLWIGAGFLMILAVGLGIWLRRRNRTLPETPSEREHSDP